MSQSQVEEIKAARKANQNKKIEKRLYVLEMYGAGKRQKEMQEVSGFCRSYINVIIKAYKEKAGEDIFVFSPGATSFGMFQNEFDRGNKYMAAVKEIF